MDDCRKKRMPWSLEDELALIEMWRERRSEINSNTKRDSNVYKEISAEFQEMGKQIMPIKIRSKIFNLKTKYKRTVALMESSDKTEWPLFNAIQSIMEGDQAEEMKLESITDSDVEFADTSVSLHQFETVMLHNGKIKRRYWTDQEELLFVNMWQKRQPEYQIAKHKSQILKLMSADLQKLGMKIGQLDIQCKMGNLMSKYKKLKQSMEQTGDTPTDWPIFNKVRDIIEDKLFHHLDKQMEEDTIEAPHQTANVTTHSVSSTCDAFSPNIFAQENDMPLANNFQPDDNKRGYRNWPQEEEIILVNIWRKRKAEFQSKKTNIQIYNEMCEEFQKLGIELDSYDIKNKIHSLKRKYRRRARRKISSKRSDDWPLFDAIRNIMEDDNDEHAIEENALEDLDKLITCGLIQFNTKQLRFIFDCQMCEKKYTRLENFLQHVQKKHVLLLNEQLQIIRENVEKLEEFATSQEEDVYNKEQAKQNENINKFSASNQQKDEDEKVTTSISTKQSENMNVFSDTILNEDDSEDLDKLLTCGLIQFSTKDQCFMYDCQMCEEQYTRIENFLQHVLKRHVLLLEEQLQILRENAEKLEEGTTSQEEDVDDEENAEQNENINKFYTSNEEEYEDYKVQYEVANIDDVQQVAEKDYDDDNKKTQSENIDVLLDIKLEQEENQEDTEANMQPEFEQQPTSTTNANSNDAINDINLKNIKRSQHGFHCPHCNKIFKWSYAIKAHIRRHLGIRKFACDICEKTFADHSNLNVHMKRHLRIKSHLCGICSKAFTSNFELATHMRHHTQEKPYKCSECPLTFRTGSKLCLHKRHHRNERPYACQFCDKRFFVKDSLIEHTRIHTKERPFECSICQAKFARPNTLRQHMNLHSGKRTYKCQYCNATFAQRAGLFGHLKCCREKPKQQANELEENANSSDQV